MTSAAYYNEIDPFAAEWLRNLIAAGHIADGEVDTRSIEDVQPDDLRDFTQCHFFAGIGVWSHALRIAGWPDDRPVWTGSCPCQPFSTAGKGEGFADQRHLWPAWHHLIRECAPDIVLGEQVASKDGLAWLDLVRADLEASSYSFGAFDICAAGVGAPHIRQRLWIVAEWLGHTDDARLEGQRYGHRATRRWFGTLRSASSTGEPSGSGPTNGYWRDADWLGCRDGKWRPVEPGTFPLAHGAPARVGRLRAYGNAIVAPLAAEFVSAYLSVDPTAGLL